MTKEEPERIKQGYQPIHSKNTSVIPPNAGSHVRMKENEYTWKDLDKAWWEGFDNAKNKMEKRIADLEKENAELKELLDCKNCCELEESECGSCVEYGHFRCKGKTRLTKAKAIIKKLYSHVFQGMDFMEINDYNVQKAEAEQFLKEVSE